MQARDIIDKLALQPHPEGGWYRQTWCATAKNGARPAGTAIYYLLEKHQKSHWHHVDADEIWHYYAGAPLTLSIAENDIGPARDYVLGPNILQGEEPQILVPKHRWQAACANDDWTLVGCTVSPAFQFEGFHLAPEGFDIPRG
ncbi:MAG: putative cupin superfamily sugar epimerase [Paracoccaceae bacterium]|jgi:predicted cupin superfamily sugar epimerase